MKYYIKSAKGYWLAQGNGYTQTKAKPMLSLDQMLQFAFNLDGCTPSDSPKHFKGYFTTLCYAKSLVAIKL